MSSKHSSTDKRKILVAVIFLLSVALTAALVFLEYRHIQRKDMERNQREEQHRLDSVRAAREEQERIDAERKRIYDETVAKFITPSSILTPCRALAPKQNSFEMYGDEYEEIDAFRFADRPGNILQSLGYRIIGTRVFKKPVCDENNLENFNEKTYGINCSWNESEKIPVPEEQPWSCVTVTETYCGHNLRIFFDTSERATEFFSKAISLKGIKQEPGSERYGGWSVEKWDDGKLHVYMEGECDGGFYISRPGPTTVLIES